VPSDSDSTERPPFPRPPEARVPDSEGDSTQRELSHLRSQQVAAIRNATYLGMTAEEAQDFEERSLRIKELIASLGRNKT
jgi:phosphoribosylformylglycinamidine (FGAM) synthase PurS component